MPYLFKLSDRIDPDWESDSDSDSDSDSNLIKENLEWISAVIRVAWFVSSECADKNSELRFYLVNARTNKPKSSELQSSNLLGSKPSSSELKIKKHNIPFEYFTKQRIGRLRLRPLTNTVNDDLISSLYEFTRKKSDLEDKLYPAIRGLPNDNPIKQIVFSFSEHTDLKDLYLHITCSNNDASINENGLYSEAVLEMLNLRTINHTRGGKTQKNRKNKRSKTRKRHLRNKK